MSQTTTPAPHLLELGAAAALACCATAGWYLTTQHPELFAKAERWVRRNAPAWRSKVSSAAASSNDPLCQSVLESGEQPWPAEGVFPGPPHCRPISTISELLTWQPPRCTHTAADQLQQHGVEQQPASSGVPALPASSSSAGDLDPCACTTPLHLPSSSHSSASSSSSSSTTTTTVCTTSSRPQLLVCHDMMGGYLRYESDVCGSSEFDEYRMWHWDCVDVFCYFSHHMVTVPPVGWIHAAHKHGVKVLGTFITEFGQGRLRCDRLFSSPETARRVADQLVAICTHYGFEGWLVNIENPLTAAQVSVMQHFVGYLRARTRDTCGPNGMVVWYDAVTTAGKLNWQNGLTPLNSPFFDLSDALFVNYTWTPSTLSPTTAAAGARATSVYMGVDVFGRGSYGGGGWGVVKALAAAADAGLSAALFAPGWVRENLDKSRFHELQDRWWHQVQHTWGLHHPVVTRLPLSTTFNTGVGLAWFVKGVPTSANTASRHAPALTSVGGETAQQTATDATSSGGCSSSSWYNLLHTDTLPCARDPISQQVVTGGPVSGYLSGCTAFEGGSCFVIYHDQQKQQQQQDTAELTAPAQSSTGADGGAVTTSPCCCPVLPVPTSTGGSSSSSSSSSTQLALLQLYSAHVPVGDRDCAVSLRCTYAAPASPPGAVAARDPQLVGDASSSTSNNTDGGSAPVLWLLVDTPSHTAAGGGGGTARQRLLLLPLSSPTATSTLSKLEPAASTSRGQHGCVQPSVPVTVQLVPQKQVQQQQQQSGRGGAGQRQPVHLPPAPPAATQPPPSAAGAGEAEAVAAEGVGSAANSRQPSWLSPLNPAEVLSSWEWAEAGWRLPVCAGSVITGIGVAVEADRGEGEGRVVDVLALLGKVEVALVVE